MMILVNVYLNRKHDTKKVKRVGNEKLQTAAWVTCVVII